MSREGKHRVEYSRNGRLFQNWLDCRDGVRRIWYDNRQVGDHEVLNFRLNDLHVIL